MITSQCVPGSTYKPPHEATHSELVSLMRHGRHDVHNVMPYFAALMNPPPGWTFVSYTVVEGSASDRGDVDTPKVQAEADLLRELAAHSRALPLFQFAPRLKMGRKKGPARTRMEPAGMGGWRTRKHAAAASAANPESTKISRGRVPG
jgi:hypothetical protein